MGNSQSDRFFNTTVSGLYANPGTYTIKIKGRLGGNFNVFGSINENRLRFDVGPSPSTNLNLIIGSSAIPYILGIQNFSTLFKNCTNLTSLGQNMFLPFRGNPYRFIETFRNCTSLVNVPASTIDNMGYFTLMMQMFQGCTLSTTSWSNLLIRMADLESNRPAGCCSNTWHGGFSKYNSGALASRNYLIITQNWTITDGGPA
jgi:hypothetical protein